MIKKMILNSFLVAILSFALTSQVMAASVDIAGDCFYFANGDLTVTSLTSGVEIARFSDIDGVNFATEVVVEHGKAVVTTDDLVTKEAVIVDISGLTGCFDNEDDDKEQYRAKYKSRLGTSYLEIPEVEVGDKIYHVTMEQRGNSSNWEVTFVEEVVEEEEPEED